MTNEQIHTAPSATAGEVVSAAETQVLAPQGELEAALRQAVASIAPELLSQEPTLSQVKWFDYRYLSAVECTRRFAEAYVSVYRDFWAELRDYDEAQFQQPIQTANVFANPPAILTSIWVARMSADVLGARYGEYCRVAFRHLIGDRIWQRLPMPNQLCSDDVVDFIADYLSESDAGVARWRNARDVRFKADNFRNDEPQEALVRELFQRIYQKDRSMRGSYLSHLIEKREVPEHLAREEFGDDLVDEYSRSPDAEPKQFTEGTLDAYLPGCFGLPHASACDRAVCGVCTFSSACKDVATNITRSVIAVHGSPDPKGARKRTLAAERKRRQRERERAAKESPGVDHDGGPVSPSDPQAAL
jgi:hypothetical protein